jgi:hypothetical protein
MFIWTLNLVMPTSPEDTVRVRIAVVDCPGASLLPSRFHVRVNGPFAFVGLQLVVLMFKVNARPLPVFLTKTVLVMLHPGVKVPQFTELMGVVHALLEYTPKFADVVTDLMEYPVLYDVITAAKAVSDKAIPLRLVLVL